MASSMPMWTAADLGANGLTLTTTRSMSADAVLDELLELLVAVAPREDPGVDRRVEGLDLAADEGRDVRQLGDRGGLDPVRGEVLAGAVGGEELTPRPRRSRAKAEMPSRLATDSSARTGAVLLRDGQVWAGAGVEPIAGRVMARV